MVAKNIRADWSQDLKVYWYSLRLQLRSAMSLRGAFIIQSIGTLVNNAAFLVAWLFLFHAFGTINGWHARELIGLTGINMAVWGIVVLGSVGITDLPRHVDRGSLDTFLTRPRPVLLQLAGNNIDPTAFTDVLLGLGLAGWYIAVAGLTIVQLGIFLVAIVVSLVLLWCFALLLPNILAFWVYDSERLSAYATRLILDSSSYPTGIITGGFKLFLLTLLPGLFIGAVPLEVLHRFKPQWVLLGVGVAAFWLIDEKILKIVRGGFAAYYLMFFCRNYILK